MSVRTIRVELAGRGYDIAIGPGLIDQAGVLCRPLLAAPKATIVSDETVAPLYAARLAASFDKAGVKTSAVTVPAGESSKEFTAFGRLVNELLDQRPDRKTTLVALGGGVVGDITGFAAAVLLRGVDFIQVPTTLLAQVDSSVGGKTAINHPLGKNMVGAFHQPAAVIADTDTLATLPAREYASGLAEVAKYGAIRDRTFLDWIEAHAQALVAREPAALAHAIRRSCEIKAAIVAEDERESGARALLNFGHTFGHAIESAAGYGNWLHGEAVAVGMALAARFSVRQGRLGPAEADRLVALLERLGLPVAAPAFPAERWLEFMGRDKKNEGGRVTLILLDGLGQGAVVRDAPETELRRFLAAA